VLSHSQIYDPPLLGEGQVAVTDNSTYKAFQLQKTTTYHNISTEKRPLQFSESIPKDPQYGLFIATAYTLCVLLSEPSGNMSLS
jgi:hypothetical protein